MTGVIQRKKLIEVALPLEAINAASAREKSIRHGHPSTLHLWWARRPLAAARAVIFAQMVDDPSAHPDLFPTEKAQEKERQRLFKIIEELVQWENTTNEEVLQKAREEIWQSWRRACADNADHPRAAELFDRNKLPGFHDPFAGGGALPLEAQRLGLEAYASDLNPVAVLINKAMIEIPPRFAGRPPVNPEWQSKPEREKVLRTWKGAQGLAEDVRYYGKWMRDEAEKRIGHLYPKIEVTAEMAKDRPDLKPYVGRSLTVIAWLWARTVRSPNPAFAGVHVPLASTFMLATKVGKEAYVEPVIEDGGYRFTVNVGKPTDSTVAKAGTKLSRGANFKCIMSGSPISGDHIKAEGKAGRMDARMMAIVAEGHRERVYLEPMPDHIRAACEAKPVWKPEDEFFQQALGFRIGVYGMSRWGDLFTRRQLVALTTFSELATEAMTRVAREGRSHSGGNTGTPGEKPPQGYAEAVVTLLALALGKSADYWTSLAAWQPDPKNLRVGHLFTRQAIPMCWDYGESNPIGNTTANFPDTVAYIANVLDRLPVGLTLPTLAGVAKQADAQMQQLSRDALVSTDPPYYDNVGYADLSDFFYVWLRRSLRSVYPELFATVSVPKVEELVATPARHGGSAQAEQFFLQGMTRAMQRLADQAHPGFPVTIYYAFKQSESENGSGTISTGWETFLDAVIHAGFGVSGTWPTRTELANRLRAADSNALASSIVLVCRKRQVDAPTVTRREFVALLKAELPVAMARLQRSNIAPVDLAQAAIGPGMAAFTRHSQVLDASGRPMTVREALALINQTLDEVLTEQEGDFDPDSRWAIQWFEQFGFAEGEFGVAETLSKAKNTSVRGMVEAGIVVSKAGKVRLKKPAELPGDWDPAKDARLTAWESVHHLIRALEKGEAAAAELVKQLGSKAEIARELAYRLYTVCERKKRATDALSYNALVQSWPEITRLAREGGAPKPAQMGLDDLEG
jgi:putative DNA methylase